MKNSWRCHHQQSSGGARRSEFLWDNGSRHHRNQSVPSTSAAGSLDGRSCSGNWTCCPHSSSWTICHCTSACDGPNFGQDEETWWESLVPRADERRASKPASRGWRWGNIPHVVSFFHNFLIFKSLHRMRHIRFMMILHYFQERWISRPPSSSDFGLLPGLEIRTSVRTGSVCGLLQLPPFGRTREPRRTSSSLCHQSQSWKICRNFWSATRRLWS